MASIRSGNSGAGPPCLLTPPRTYSSPSAAPSSSSAAYRALGPVVDRTSKPRRFASPGKIAYEESKTPDLLPVLDELKAGIDSFISGFELPVPAAVPAAAEAVATEVV